MTWLCSNEKCPNKSKYSGGSTCQTCGSPVREYRYGNLFHHLSVKSKKTTESENAEQKESKPKVSKKELLVSEDMSDEDLEKAIHEDLATVSSHHRWIDLADLLEGGDEDSPETRLLTALVDQVKILIRQNELILRSLRHRTSYSAKTNSARVDAVSTAQ